MIARRVKAILPMIGRVVLSVLVIFAGWGILYLLAAFLAYLNRESNNNGKQTLKADPQITSIVALPNRPRLWPQYPVHGSIGSHELILNSIPITIEEWESTSLPRNILDYYALQMMARGWRDSMNEVRSLIEVPVLHLQNGTNETAKIAPLFLQGVQPDGNLSLELQRSGWSMSITVEPSGKSINQSRVTIMAAPVPSLRDFSTKIAEANQPAPFGSENKPLDIVRKSNGMRYHTTSVIKKKEATQALKESIVNLRAQDWRLSLSPFRQGNTDYFAWLVRGKQYATLSVKAIPQGVNSMVMVTFTEVTPE